METDDCYSPALSGAWLLAFNGKGDFCVPITSLPEVKYPRDACVPQSGYQTIETSNPKDMGILQESHAGRRKRCPKITQFPPLRLLLVQPLRPVSSVTNHRQVPRLHPPIPNTDIWALSKLLYLKERISHSLARSFSSFIPFTGRLDATVNAVPA